MHGFVTVEYFLVTFWCDPFRCFFEFYSRWASWWPSTTSTASSLSCQSFSAVSTGPARTWSTASSTGECLWARLFTERRRLRKSLWLIETNNQSDKPSHCLHSWRTAPSANVALETFESSICKLCPHIIAKPPRATRVKLSGRKVKLATHEKIMKNFCTSFLLGSGAYKINEVVKHWRCSICG